MAHQLIPVDEPELDGADPTRRYLLTEEIEELKAGDSWVAIVRCWPSGHPEHTRVIVEQVTLKTIKWRLEGCAVRSALKSRAYIPAKPTLEEYEAQDVADLRRLFTNGFDWASLSASKLHAIHHLVFGRAFPRRWLGEKP